MTTNRYFITIKTDLLKDFENYLIQNKYEFSLISTNFTPKSTVLMYAIDMDEQDAVKIKLTFDITGMLDEKILFPKGKT
jgi:hypothetical protein